MLSPTIHRAEDVIRQLALEPLPQEGCWFRRTAEAGTTADGAPRAWSLIYLLITPEGFSALHRLVRDELWIFQAGDPLEVLRLLESGQGEHVILGLDPGAGQHGQLVMPAGVWQGARLAEGGRWALATCVVVPEFRWEDFRLGRRNELVESHPRWTEQILRLTRA